MVDRQLMLVITLLVLMIQGFVVTLIFVLPRLPYSLFLQQQRCSQLCVQCDEAERSVAIASQQQGNVDQKMSLFQKFVASELDTVLLGGKRYHFSRDEKINEKLSSFNAAKAICRASGMQLASVETQLENQLLINHTIKLAGRVTHYWLGGTDKGSEGKWYWTGTDNELTFEYWRDGEPSNSGDSGEHCMGMWAQKERNWNDWTCHTLQRFICELEI